MGNRLIFLYLLVVKLTFWANTGSLVWLSKHNGTLENRNGEKRCNVRWRKPCHARNP